MTQMSAIPDMAVCLVPGGHYTIGSENFPESQPAHIVTLADFEIGRTVVTNQHFAAFIQAGGYKSPEYWTEAGWRWQAHRQEVAPGFWDDANFNHALQPVTGVSWYEADAFARWLRLATGQPWRLLTEAEWEVAARDPKTSEWTPNPKQLNTVEHNLGRPWSALGMGHISRFGVYDMCGNVWEWTTSRWGRNWQTLEYYFPYVADDGREDLSGSYARVIRGGSWFDALPKAHPSHRGRYLPGSRGSNIGFRLARTL